MIDKFDINKILEEYNPDQTELAKVLYPDNKFPDRAFARVLLGEAHLDTEQITRLAAYLGVLVPDLFAAGGWKGNWDGTAKCPIFTKGRYKVLLNYNGSFLTIYEDHIVIRREIRSNTDTRTLNEFISHLDDIIRERKESEKLKKYIDNK